MYNYKQNFHKPKPKNLSEEDKLKLDRSKNRALTKLHMKHVDSLVCVVLSSLICSDFYDTETITGLDLNNFVYGVTDRGYPYAFYEDETYSIMYIKKNGKTVKKVEPK